MSRRISAALVTAALVTFVLNVQPAMAQAPTVVMFYGGTLKAPVSLTDADAALFHNLLSPASIAAKDMGDRPYVSVAVFWASRSDPANNGTPVAQLKPAMAWQHGRFFPPSEGKPGVLLVTPMTKGAQPVPIPSNGAAFVWGGAVSDAGLAVLKRVGVLR